MARDFLRAKLRLLSAKFISLSFREKLADLMALDESYSEFFTRASYNADGLLTFHDINCLTRADFVSAYSAGERTGSWKGGDVRWRASICCWAARHCLSLPGDYVECGVNRGGMALTVIEYAQLFNANKDFFLYDTFDGIHSSLLTDDEKDFGVQPDRYEECYAAVCNTFRKYPNVKIVRGEVPTTLHQRSPDKVAFLSIDMNCVVPEIEALQFFWDKVVPGGIIILDDYGWKSHHLQKKAFDQFCLSHQLPILQLPTGQGLLIKPSS